MFWGGVTSAGAYRVWAVEPVVFLDVEMVLRLVFVLLRFMRCSAFGSRGRLVWKMD